MPVRRLLLLAALAVVAAGPALAQSRLTGFDLLRVTPSARAAALAGAYTPAPAPAPDALLYNPAFLTEGAADQAALGVLNHVGDLWMGFAAYARQAPRVEGTVGVAVRHLSYGSFDRTTWEGTTEGTFGASETVLTVAYARAVSERLQAGANVHAAYVAIEEASGSALAADVGVAYTVPEQGLVLSAALRNAGVTLSSLGDTADRLPLDLRVSASKQLANVPLRLSATAYDLTSFEGENGTALAEIARHVALGGELQFGSAFALRAGYDFRQADDLGTGDRFDFAGLGAGFGLNLRRVGFDYAYNTWSAFGGLHHLTVRARL
jgi:hypothetical protein